MVIIGVFMKLKGFREYLKRLNRSETTITSYCNAIELYQKSGYRFTFENACAWKEQQIETMSPNTVNARIYAVNAYSRYREAGWQLSPLQTTTSQYVDNQLTMQQYLIFLEKLLGDEQFLIYFIVKLLASTGIRISEAVKLRFCDIERGYADILGKGTKIRRIWFPARLRKELAKMEYNPEDLIMSMTGGAFRKKLHYYAAKYRMDTKPFHPHEFRAFFARNIYAKTKDIKLVQDLLGHANIQTTMRYLRKTTRGISVKISRLVTW